MCACSLLIQECDRKLCCRQNHAVVNFQLQHWKFQSAISKPSKLDFRLLAGGFVHTHRTIDGTFLKLNGKFDDAFKLADGNIFPHVELFHSACFQALNWSRLFQNQLY